MAIGFTNNLSAQKDSIKTQKPEAISWTHVGLWGVGKFNKIGDSFHATLNTNFSVKKTYFQIGFNVTGIFYSVADFNVSIGQRLSGRFYHIAAFIGPSLVFSKMGDGEFTTIGLSYNLQLVLKPLKQIGVGIGLYSNLNVNQNAFGIRGIIHFSNGL